MFIENGRMKLTECHELRADGDGKDDEVEYLDHAQVRVGAVRNELSADEEQKCLSEVDQTIGDSEGAALDEGASHTG